MGFLALIIIAGVIFLRYRSLSLTLPIFATILAETIILVGILSLPIFKQPFDLAAFAGLIAALGSGVNSEIVIVDELMNKTKRETLSLLQRVKEGLFIITTSAITMIGVMGPIVLLSKTMPGLSGLYGFAMVAILGAIIGVVITRPAFTKIVETIVEKKEEKEKKK
jgi:preprotein translocase subunit SecD